MVLVRLGKHTAMHMCPLLLVEFEFWSQQQATLTQIWAENVSPVLSSLVWADHANFDSLSRATWLLVASLILSCYQSRILFFVLYLQKLVSVFIINLDFLVCISITDGSRSLECWVVIWNNVLFRVSSTHNIIIIIIIIIIIFINLKSYF